MNPTGIVVMVGTSKDDRSSPEASLDTLPDELIIKIFHECMSDFFADVSNCHALSFCVLPTSSRPGNIEHWLAPKYLAKPRASALLYPFSANKHLYGIAVDEYFKHVRYETRMLPWKDTHTLPPHDARARHISFYLGLWSTYGRDGYNYSYDYVPQIGKMVDKYPKVESVLVVADTVALPSLGLCEQLVEEMAKILVPALAVTFTTGRSEFVLREIKDVQGETYQKIGKAMMEDMKRTYLLRGVEKDFL